MNDSLDVSKLSNSELRVLWRTGMKPQRKLAAKELGRRGVVQREANKKAALIPNNPATAAPTNSILDPLAGARSGLNPRLRDEVVIRFEGETHTLKLAEWLRSLRSHPVG